MLLTFLKLFCSLLKGLRDSKKVIVECSAFLSSESKSEYRYSENVAEFYLVCYKTKKKISILYSRECFDYDEILKS